MAHQDQPRRYGRTDSTGTSVNPTCPKCSQSDRVHGGAGKNRRWYYCLRCEYAWGVEKQPPAINRSAPVALPQAPTIAISAPSVIKISPVATTAPPMVRMSRAQRRKERRR